MIPFGRLLGCSQLAGGAAGQRPAPLPAQLTHNSQKIRDPTIQNSSPNQAELDSVPGLNPPGPASRIVPIDLLAVGRQVCPSTSFSVTPATGPSPRRLLPPKARKAMLSAHTAAPMKWCSDGAEAGPMGLLPSKGVGRDRRGSRPGISCHRAVRETGAAPPKGSQHGGRYANKEAKRISRWSGH